MTFEITYLDHSGFAVCHNNNVYIFDYSNTIPADYKKGLEGGVIDPAEFAGKNVFVFVSHRHGDHFLAEIYEWRNKLENINYIISKDARPPSFAHSVKPNESYSIDGIDVSTLKSTDEGVAFIVEENGKTIYHAGDLNWWHWEGEPKAWNNNMAANYKAQINRLKGKQIDLAFVPVDPRLGDELLWGMNYLMETADIAKAIPMHFWKQPERVTQAFASAEAAGYREKLLPPMERGTRVCL